MDASLVRVRLFNFWKRTRIAELLIGMGTILPLLTTGVVGPTAARGQTGGCHPPPSQTMMQNILDSLESEVTSEHTIANVHGEPYRAVDLAISGQMEGCVIPDAVAPLGRRPLPARLTDAPGIIPEILYGYGPDLPGSPSPYSAVVRGVGRFEAADGSGMQILYPESSSAWNGKLWTMHHGGGLYNRLPELAPRNSDGRFTPSMSQGMYVGLMIDKGYAVAWIRKDQTPAGVSWVQLEDGTLVTQSMQWHTALDLALTRRAQRFIEERLGQRPARTYFYGYSGGGPTGQLTNYVPGANLDRDGSRVVDGFLIDDAAPPVMFRIDAPPLLNATPGGVNLAPQIDLSHSLYTLGEYRWIQGENERLLLEHGLGDRHRLYEVLGVNHFDAGRPAGRRESLDLGGIMEAVIDALDSWVDLGIPPPPSRVDEVEGIRGAIALPEIACPLGVHYPFPADARDENNASQASTFAAFDGTSLEPLDWRGEFVDMNKSGVRDRRESVEEAWRRLGLLGSDDAFTTARYASCVDTAATTLAEERLLPWRVVDYYRDQAASFSSGG